MLGIGWLSPLILGSALFAKIIELDMFEVCKSVWNHIDACGVHNREQQLEYMIFPTVTYVLLDNTY